LANRASLLETFKSKGIESIQNDFEFSVFQTFPQIQVLKNALLSAGAIYAAMSGSGSSVFGIFETAPSLSEDLSAQVIYNGLWSY
jgi:4-diphosphocytidyl-2-C-methyl-D-erythritol kinase